MPDERISSAVREASERLGQPDALAQKILAWMDAVAEGRESLDDGNKVTARLELLFDTTIVDDADESEED